jgi:hypothetical protein
MAQACYVTQTPFTSRSFCVHAASYVGLQSGMDAEALLITLEHRAGRADLDAPLL